VAGSRWYNPHWHYENEPRAALDPFSVSAAMSRVCSSHRETAAHGDYMHLAIWLPTGADQRLCQLYADLRWAYTRSEYRRQEILQRPDVAEYAADIWNVKPVGG
jgi:starch phosphorylase